MQVGQIQLVRETITLKGSASWPDTCAFFPTGLSYILKRTKSVGQQQQTLKQRPSCVEPAHLYMKKMASPFICHNELYKKPEVSIIHYSVFCCCCVGLPKLTHTGISKCTYCSSWELKGYGLASTTLWLMFNTCCMISDVWTVCKHSEEVTHAKPYCDSDVVDETSLQINDSLEYCWMTIELLLIMNVI